MKKELNNAGFSLLEVVLAMAILAIISIPLLSYFTDSMKYNTKMADKQHATNLAQEIAEDLKAQDKLIQDTATAGSTPFYGVPYLTTKGYVASNNTLDAKGVGSVVYTGYGTAISEDYDVKISIDTNKVANTKLLPQIYGIDDTSDVLLVDDSQFDQALTYFRTINTNYAVSHPAAKLSDDAIKRAMKRKITVSISKGAGSNGYDVVARASYRCAKLEGSSSGEKTFDLTEDLVNTHLGGKKAVHAIYFLYTYNAGSTEDTLAIENKGTGVACEPEVHIICQNPTDIQAASSYRFYLETYYKPLQKSQIYTNLSDSLKAGILYGNGTPVSAKEDLVSTGAQVRTVDMQIEIYKKGQVKTTGAEPYITVKASKGE